MPRRTFLSDYLEQTLGSTADPEVAALLTDPKEIVVEQDTGRVRQAGATVAGPFMQHVKRGMEQNLYAFAKQVLGRDYLTEGLHGQICAWLERCPPRRKLLLLPREHAKTTIVSHALPLHVLIQDKASNPYFPGEWGESQRIYLCGETEKRASDHLRVIRTALEGNPILRGLWGRICWDQPSRDARKWNDNELIVRRPAEYPDPSIRAIGVGGAITGAHPTVLLKDDLISLEAANSPIVMQAAITWHVASRALINRDECLEFIVGTRWAVHDLYHYIMEKDPTVEVLSRAIVENGATIYPEVFSLDKVAELRRTFGTLFPLLYMNSAADPSLVDFGIELLRDFEIVGDRLRFQGDERDADLATRLNAPAPDTVAPMEGTPLTGESWQAIYRPGEGFRLRG